MNELDLLSQAKSGNKSALNSLLKNNYPVLYGYVFKMTGNAASTEDIVQEAMLKAIVNIDKFKPEAKFSTWLITIATNVFRDSLRKNKATELLDENISDITQDVENTVITRFEYQKVMEILLNLSYEKRAVFILKNYYGYKYEEIAVILKCPIGTVRSRLHNSIKYIMDAMKGSEN